MRLSYIFILFVRSRYTSQFGNAKFSEIRSKKCGEFNQNISPRGSFMKRITSFFTEYGLTENLLPELNRPKPHLKRLFHETSSEGKRRRRRKGKFMKDAKILICKLN